MTYDDDYITDKERRISRWLAIAMHVAFVLLLVFGVAWQKRHSEPSAIVDLWSSLPPPRQEPVPVPVPRSETKPEPRPEPRPAPKPEAKPLPKPDIALKEKLDKERRLKEQIELEKKKVEQQKRKDDEAKKLKAQQLEAQKKEDEKRKLDKERLAQEAELKRLAQEKADAAARLAKEQAAAQAGAVAKYKRQIEDKIRNNIPLLNLPGNPEVVYEVRILPGGDIVEVSLRMVRSSGIPAYDEAVARAILRSSPLPVPSDPLLFNEFRELKLPVRPKP